MGNAIIIGVLFVIIVIALLRTKKHFKGGGCCGSGSSTVRSTKKLTEPKIGEKIVSIQGMHCENCQNRIERAVNKLDGVVCKVNLKKNNAIITYSREISDSEITEIIEKLDFKVTAIR